MVKDGRQCLISCGFMDNRGDVSIKTVLLATEDIYIYIYREREREREREGRREGERERGGVGLSCRLITFPYRFLFHFYVLYSFYLITAVRGYTPLY